MAIEKYDNFGVKTDFLKLMNNFMSNTKYNNFVIKTFALLPNNLFKKFLQEGKLQELNFEIWSMPDSPESKVRLNNKRRTSKGAIVLSVRSKKGLPEKFKELVNDISEGRAGKLNSIVGIELGDDEVSVRIKGNSGKKTFYLK